MSRWMPWSRSGRRSKRRPDFVASFAGLSPRRSRSLSTTKGTKITKNIDHNTIRLRPAFRTGTLSESTSHLEGLSSSCDLLRGSSLFSSERPHDDMLSIGINRDLPVPICSIDLRADGFESPNDFQCRMTERIPPPAADERNLRMPGVEQLLRRRRAAAVMRDLENARLRLQQMRRNRPFDLAPDVASEKERDVAIYHLQHNRA